MREPHRYCVRSPFPARPWAELQTHVSGLLRQAAACRQAVLNGTAQAAGTALRRLQAHAELHVQQQTQAHAAFASISHSIMAKQQRNRQQRHGDRGNKPALPIVGALADATKPNTQTAAPGSHETAGPAEGAQHGSSNGASPIAVPEAVRHGTRKDEEEAERREERILISEVHITGLDNHPELKAIAQQASMSLKPNFAYSIREVQAGIANIFNVGCFNGVKAGTADTRDGVRLELQVTPNPVLRRIDIIGANELPHSVAEEAFKGQAGAALNFNGFARGIDVINGWYEGQGLVGEVMHSEQKDDVIELKVEELRVNSINLRFTDRKTGELKDEGRTRPDVIMRHLCTKPGQVFNTHQAKQDIDTVFSTGLFDDVHLSPQPVEGTTSVDLTLQVAERKAGGIAMGGGISGQGYAEGAIPAFIGSASYMTRNLFGLNQKLVASVEVGQVDRTFRLSHTDPWLRGDAHRTSRVLKLENTRTSGNVIHGRAPDELSGSPANADGGGEGNIVVARLVSGVEYGRPLATGWTGTLGLNWQRATCTDDHGNKLLKDPYDAPLTFSGKESDTMALALLRAVYSGRRDSQLVLSTEQAVPLVPSWLNFNRLQVRVERSVALANKGRVRAYFSGKGGAIIGDMPPYEAFPIGGTQSVRGYSEGGVGSGRRYMTGTAELQFPLWSPIEGTLLADWGSDLGSGASVPGDPAGVRGKPGSGMGIGAGIRIESPVGPLRFEYALNRDGAKRFHIGLGSHG